FVGSCVRLPVTRHPPPPDIGNQRNETQNPRLETPLPRSRVSRGETERGWAMGIASHNDDRSPRRRQEGPRVSYWFSWPRTAKYLPFETSPPGPLSSAAGEGELLRRVLPFSFPLSTLWRGGQGVRF